MSYISIIVFDLFIFFITFSCTFGIWKEGKKHGIRPSLSELLLKDGELT